jgi:hypothetical protein
MSNQVFANQTKKFFPCPGLNAYVMSTPVIVDPSDSDFLLFDTVVLEQGPGITNTSSGALTFLQEGIYSIKALVSLQTVADTDAIAYSLKLSLVGGFAATGTILDEKKYYSATSSAANYIETLTYTGFFNINDVVTTRLLNLNGAALKTLTCSDAVCQLIVCKLA